jgi:hypothetical protein
MGVQYGLYGVFIEEFYEKIAKIKAKKGDFNGNASRNVQVRGLLLK